jgi:hypothetical protein
VTPSIRQPRVEKTREEKEFLLRGYVCAYLTFRLMGELAPV